MMLLKMVIFILSYHVQNIYTGSRSSENIKIIQFQFWTRLKAGLKLQAKRAQVGVPYRIPHEMHIYTKDKKSS